MLTFMWLDAHREITQGCPCRSTFRNVAERMPELQETWESRVETFRRAVMLRPQEYRNCLFGNTLTRIGIGVLASAVFTLLIVVAAPAAR